MERLYLKCDISSWLSFLFVFQLLMSAQGQTLCSAAGRISVFENNTVGAVITNITVEPDVNLLLQPVDSPFELNENVIIAKEVLDSEKQTVYNLIVTCTKTSIEERLNIIVIVVNVNDNPPVFEKSQYSFNVNELSPVGTVVANVPAKDVDENTQLFYTLDPETEGFVLRSQTTPNIFVQTPLDYDAVKNIQLTLSARDTEQPSPEGEPSFTATTTIQITIVDVDNRPPWFKPCTEYSVNGAKVCQGSGYSGSVTLTEQQAGPLQLEPGPLYAIDGDFGINEEITYGFLSGNEANLFEINPSSGNITMLRPANVPGPINLIAMAAQKVNTLQFSTTTVTIKIRPKSLHPPRFERDQYDCFVTGVGAMALDLNDNSPIRILATDADYEGGVNPDIRYILHGSNNFILIDGYLFMTIDNPLGMVSLQVEAVDTASTENTSIHLNVEVTTGIPTTSKAPNTTDIVSTTPIEITTEIVLTTMTTVDSLSTTNSTVTTQDISTSPSVTTQDISTPPSVTTQDISTPPSVTTQDISTPPSVTTQDISTPPSVTTQDISTSPSVTTQDISTSPSVTTQDSSTPPSVTTQDSPSTKPSETTADVTTHANTGAALFPSGGYKPEDMAALGASLAVLLFISAVVIGVLACRIRKGNAAWKKISEASIFRSSLGRSSSSWKEGVQYTNESFQHDDDSGSTGSGSLVRTANIRLGAVPGARAGDIAMAETVVKSTPPPANKLSNGYSTDLELDQPDGEKEVKPILTKERRVDEGYKSVWFKEDIDPNTKDEVVIIPDRGEEPEDEEEGEEEEEDEDSSSRSTPAVDTDLDSGIGVKM